MNSSHKLGVGIILSTISIANPSWADSSDAIETVVVSGKLQAKVVDAGPLGTLDILTTPYSINSVTADTIELRQTRTLIELQKTDPSAQFLFDGFGAPIIAIRGFTSDVRLDGTRTQVSSQFPLEFVDRIDIIKGASSFLYGFVAPGGIVDYSLKRPEPDAFVVGALSYRSDTDGLARVDINQPITDTLGVRLNGLYEYGQTYLQDDVQHRGALSVASTWQPSEAIKIQGDFTYQQNAPESGGNATVLLLPGVDVPEPLDPTIRYLQKWERFRINVFAFGLRGDWTFAPDWTLSLHGRGYIQPRTYYSSGGQVLDRTGHLTNDIYAFNDGQNSFQEQASINGKFETLGAINNVTLSVDQQYDPAYTGTGFGFVAVGPYTIDDPIDVPRPPGFALPHDPEYRTNRTLQTAEMIADRIEWGPWTALAALRYISFSQKNYDPTGATVNTYGADELTPTLGLLRKIGDDISVYTSYAQGLEQGATPPASQGDPHPVPLPPVHSDQFEIGAKAQLWDRLTATGALFHLSRDYQANTFLSDGTQAFLSDGKEIHNGGELTLSGMVLPGWNVIAGATLLDAKIAHAQGFAINGDTPVGIAKFQATLFVEHEIQNGLFLNAGLFHASGRQIDTPNDRTIPGYTTFDAGVRWVTDWGGHKVSLNASVENIADERYWGGVYFGFLSLGTPRQAKVTLSTGF